MSSMRSWLNREFLQTAFNEAERNAILLTQVNNGLAQGNPEWTRNNGIHTQDQIFLLSFAEAAYYLPSEESRVCLATPYAASLLKKTEGPVYWWLRSCGSDPYTGACVSESGVNGSLEILDVPGGVRPAMRVALTALTASGD